MNKIKHFSCISPVIITTLYGIKNNICIISSLRIKMRTLFIVTLALISHLTLAANQTLYQVSFDNAVHHEARISATFAGIENQILEVQMSRASPGRYALHEFAKNVYNVSAVNSVGKPLEITRPNPYQWHIEGHDGEVTVSYTLFGDRADGTYSQIDRTHAHLNMPASFLWATGHENRAITVEFSPFSPHWKVATQLQKTADKYTFLAPNLNYFLDSPTELSDHQVSTWQVESNNKQYTINLAVHHNGIDEDLAKYTKMAKAVVAEQVKVYGELPDFDYDEYTFIACYLPHVSGDGMEHRNSTILTSTRSLDEGEFKHLGTLSHEFFHAWNVERIRPKALEPFNFSNENMTKNLWFAEGFTSYYDKLIIRRAQESSIDDYLKTVSQIVNQAGQTTGRLYYTPEGASMLATFTDASTYIDKTNFSNIFFSYYGYGRVMGLALDLSIRAQFPDKSLDNFMQQMWLDFGKPEIAYTRDDLRLTLGKTVNNQAFADTFFQNHIYSKNKPDFSKLLAAAGLQVKQIDDESAYLGKVNFYFRGQDALVSKPIKVGTPLYKVGIERGDQIVKLGRRTIRTYDLWEKALAQFKPGESATIEYIQRGEHVSKTISFISNSKVKVSKVADDELTEAHKLFLTSWLGEEQDEDKPTVETEN